ncbi:MAG: DUF5676 family membrane protein [Opitutaceae bacterium]
MKLNPKGLGLAFGVAAVFFYLGCILLMTIAGRGALVVFFNALLHGLDIGPILSAKVSFWMTILGLVNTFILSWLFGALIAVVYNGANRRITTGP